MSATEKVKEMIKSGELSLGCKVLKRTVRSIEDGSVQVTFCADDKLIQKFLKRKKSKKATAAAMR